MSRFRGPLRLVVPSATALFCGGCTMILVLVASRLVARDLGSSLYTWTATLAVVMAGMTMGTYAGGRVADRFHPRRTLSVLFGLSSASCVAILIVNNVAGEWMGLWRLNWPLHVFIHILLVFLPPVCLLAAIIPVVIRMTIEQATASTSGDPGTQASDGEITTVRSVFPHAVRVMGGLYAWYAAGGLAGTILAGFFLIPATGGAVILWLVAAAMLTMAVLYWVSCWALYLWAMVFMALATMGMSPAGWAQGVGETALLREPHDPNVLYEDQTPYAYVTVRQISKRPDRRELRQDKSQRAESFLDDPTNLQYFYPRVCAALTQGLVVNKEKPAVIVIGGGGYVLPRYLKTLRPASLVEVVEADRDVTWAATAALGLGQDAGITTVSTGARGWFDKLLKQGRAGRYDLIYEDALDDYTASFSLVTKEFNDQVHRALTDDGVYIINMIDAYESSRLLGAVVTTLGQTFAGVYVVRGDGGLPSPRHSIVVVAAKRRLDVQGVLRQYDEHLRFEVLDESAMSRLREICGGILLTDDYAPVENLAAPAVRLGAGAALAQRCFDRAKALQHEGRRDLRHAWELPRGGALDPGGKLRAQGIDECERSIQRYAMAMELDPSLSIEACNEIGLMRIEQGKPDEAERTFLKAVEYHRATGSMDPAIAAVYRNLGTLLRRMGRKTDSNAPLAEAARWLRVETQMHPRSVVAWEQLGGVLAIRDDMKGASEAFGKALEREPGNLVHYEKLARTLEEQKRYGDAIGVVRRHLKLLEDRHEREQAVQVRQHLEVLEYQRVKQPH